VHGEQSALIHGRQANENRDAAGAREEPYRQKHGGSEREPEEGLHGRIVGEKHEEIDPCPRFEVPHPVEREHSARAEPRQPVGSQ